MSLLKKISEKLERCVKRDGGKLRFFLWMPANSILMIRDLIRVFSSILVLIGGKLKCLGEFFVGVLGHDRIPVGMFVLGALYPLFALLELIADIYSLVAFKRKRDAFIKSRSEIYAKFNAYIDRKIEQKEGINTLIVGSSLHTVGLDERIHLDEESKKYFEPKKLFGYEGYARHLLNLTRDAFTAVTAVLFYAFDLTYLFMSIGYISSPSIIGFMGAVSPYLAPIALAIGLMIAASKLLLVAKDYWDLVKGNSSGGEKFRETNKTSGIIPYFINSMKDGKFSIPIDLYLCVVLAAISVLYFLPIGAISTLICSILLASVTVLYSAQYIARKLDKDEGVCKPSGNPALSYTFSTNCLLVSNASIVDHRRIKVERVVGENSVAAKVSLEDPQL